MRRRKTIFRRKKKSKRDKGERGYSGQQEKEQASYTRSGIREGNVCDKREKVF